MQQNTQISQMPMSPVAMSSISRPTIIVSLSSTSTLPPTKTSSFGTKQQQTTTQYQEQQQTQQTQQSQQSHQNTKHILQAMDSGVKSSLMPTLTTTFPSYGSQSTNTLTSSTKVHQHPQISMMPSKTNSIKGNIGGGTIQQQNTGLNLAQNITIGTTTDPSCDSYGVCYQVSLRCTDTRILGESVKAVFILLLIINYLLLLFSNILVQVRTSQPFHGRIYALGRSETCNNKIANSQHFSLEMSLQGQQCNTQNVQGVYSNTVVLQHHNVVLTKADKVCQFSFTSSFLFLLFSFFFCNSIAR